MIKNGQKLGLMSFFLVFSPLSTGSNEIWVLRIASKKYCYLFIRVPTEFAYAKYFVVELLS